jgi:hypothetical protein
MREYAYQIRIVATRAFNEISVIFTVLERHLLLDPERGTKPNLERGFVV